MSDTPEMPTPDSETSLDLSAVTDASSADELTGDATTEAPKKRTAPVGFSNPAGRPVGAKTARLSVTQGAEADLLYAGGDMKLAQLSARYGISKSALSRRFRKKGITFGSRREEIERAAQEAAKANIVTEASVLMKRIKDTKDQHYIWAEALAKMTIKQVFDAHAAKTSIASKAPEIKALDNAITALSKAMDTRFKALGLDKAEAVDANELPDLMVGQLSDDQIKQLREAQADDDNPVEVPVDLAT